mmetsp:Transcript_8201/g.23428  ORF Transcript_8201/g.23428 Transcript_8201/m.23428 type:complete len:209 (+) Transcript_8201:1080-1706(+)
MRRKYTFNIISRRKSAVNMLGMICKNNLMSGQSIAPLAPTTIPTLWPAYSRSRYTKAMLITIKVPTHMSSFVRTHCSTFSKIPRPRAERLSRALVYLANTARRSLEMALCLLRPLVSAEVVFFGEPATSASLSSVVSLTAQGATTDAAAAEGLMVSGGRSRSCRGPSAWGAACLPSHAVSLEVASNPTCVGDVGLRSRTRSSTTDTMG